MHKSLILALFLFSFTILNPIQFVLQHSDFSYIPSYNPTLAQIPTFNIGTIGSAMGNWDGVAATTGFAGADYAPNALETLMIAPEDWSGEYDDMIPVLATDWTIIERLEEQNTLGWNNTGGLQAIEFTLRSNVTFHDGSAFNATVAKWNIDRNMVISGNLTGELTDAMVFSDFYKALYTWWLPAYDWAPYETASWNVSQFIGQPASYAEFGTTKSLVWNNTGPSNSWRYQLFDSVYPRIKNVTILEDLPSGGKIRVNYNDWSGIYNYVDDQMMISMDAYNDYFDKPIYGLGDVVGFPQPDVSGGYPDPAIEFPGHLIGTGSYRFIEHDEGLQQGTMERYADWWNSTAMQANGWHKVPEIAIATFPGSTAGFTARNLAMVNGTIDLAYDTVREPLVYNDMIVDPDINYVLGGIEPTRTFITLNGINETYWKTWADADTNTTAAIGADYSHLYDIDDVTKQVTVDGINRAMRKAVSYAFNYDTYINVVQEGRAVRSGGFLGLGNEFYNPSIPLAYRDLTIARQALIDDPFWNTTLNDRQLDITNTTAQWRAVADTNPIFEFKLLWDMPSIDLANVFGNSIKDIGLTLGGLNGAPDGSLLIQPDIYTVLYGGDVGTVPWFTSHGVPTSWPGMDYKMIPVLEYYVASPGAPGPWAVFPDAASANLGFHYNDTIDEYIRKGWFADRTTLQEIMDNMTRHFQTYQYSDIMVSHNMWGYAIDKDWELSLSGGSTYAFIKYIELSLSPPGDIALSSDAGNPDIDGNFNLIWNVSLGADNYSLYRYGSEITSINGSLVSISSQTATSPFPISGLIDGEYYFVVVAHNQYGDTISNNIHITVQIAESPPESFTLSTDADFPDDDGIFNLSWTISNGADNYSLYMHNTPITVIDSSLTLLVDQMAISPFSVSGLSNGEYYFVVVAHNKYGDTMSNNVHVTVNIPGEPTTPAISGYNTLVVLGVIIFTTVILFKKKKIKAKWK